MPCAIAAPLVVGKSTHVNCYVARLRLGWLVDITTYATGPLATVQVILDIHLDQQATSVMPS